MQIFQCIQSLKQNTIMEKQERHFLSIRKKMINASMRVMEDHLEIKFEEGKKRSAKEAVTCK